MPSVFRRVRDIGRAKVDRQVEKYESPDVLARTAVRRVEETLAKLQRAAHEAKSKEIEGHAQATDARRRAAALRQRARTLLGAGAQAMAESAMTQALMEDHKAEILDAQVAELHQVNEGLAQHLATLRQQRVVIKMNADLQRARYAGAEAARLGAEARHGRPGEIGESPYELLQRAQDRSVQTAASALATVELAQTDFAAPELSLAPDFSSSARAELAAMAAAGELSGGGAKAGETAAAGDDPAGAAAADEDDRVRAEQ